MVRAVLLRRRSRLRFCGMARECWVDYERPALRCPWSPLAWSHVIRHGPAYRSDAGETTVILLDRNGYFERGTHCARDGAPSNYLVHAVTVPALPRRIMLPGVV